MLDTYIGIDPGESNGVAVYDSVNGLKLHTLNFWQLIGWIEIIEVQKQLENITPHFFVENPGLNGFMYDRKVNSSNAAMMMKVAQNVGQNKGDAKRIIERIRKADMLITEFKPSAKSQKWTADYFHALMRGRFDIKQSNQHVRDAAKLISEFWLKHKPAAI